MATPVTDSSFETDVLQSSLPVVVDFWAPWCGPCRAVGPVIDELATEYDGKIKVLKMNVDEDDCTKTPAKYGIRAIPTIIFFKGGEVVEQLTGASSKANLQEIINTKLLG